MIRESDIKESADIKKILEIIINSIDPEKIILFGSQAKGNAKEDSDYDICILKDSIKKRRQVTQNLYMEFFGSNLAIDLIVETPNRFEELKDNPYMVYKSINENGVLIYDKRDAGKTVA